MVEKNQRNFLKESSGFTLIELIVSVLVGLLLIYWFYNTYIFQDEALDKEGRKVDAVQNARNTVDILTRNLKELAAGVPDSISEEITACAS